MNCNNKQIMIQCHILIIVIYIFITAGCGSDDNSNINNNTNNPIHQNYINLSGNISFEEYIPTDEGLSDKVYVKPVKYAEYELISKEGNKISNGNLDHEGAYSIKVKNNQYVYLKIKSDTRLSNIANVYIVDSTNKIFSYISSLIDTDHVNTFDMTIPIENHGKISGAFNILDVASTCSEFIIKSTGITHPELRLTWELGNLNKLSLNRIVTNCFYQNDIKPPTIFLIGGIQLLDGTVDLTSETAHFDDMVIAHEFGHFVQNNYSVDASQGGGHNGNSLYPSLSFSEGFATWFAAVCLKNSNYISTIGLPPKQQLNFSNYNIENINNIPYRNYGIQSEFSVAELLWDIYDGSDDFPKDSDKDGINVNFSEIINVFLGWNKKKDYPFIITLLEGLNNENILTEFEIAELLSYPTDQNIIFPYSIKWPFPMKFGVIYPTNMQPYYIGIPEPGTIESEPYLFSGSFFLNQFWTFEIKENKSDVTVTFGVENEENPQVITLGIYSNDNSFISSKPCSSGNYIQLNETLHEGKYIIKIIGYIEDKEQYGRYWLNIEEKN